MWAARLSGAGELSLEALDRAPEAFLKWKFSLKVHQLASTGDIEVASRLPVRPRRIPDDLALEACELADHLGEVAYPRLAPCADVHRLRGVQPFGRKEQRPRRVVHV